MFQGQRKLRRRHTKRGGELREALLKLQRRDALQRNVFSMHQAIFECMYFRKPVSQSVCFTSVKIRSEVILICIPQLHISFESSHCDLCNEQKHTSVELQVYIVRSAELLSWAPVRAGAYLASK